MKFVIYQSETTGKFWFSIVSVNGRVVASSNLYNTVPSAEKAIYALVTSLSENPKVDIEKAF